MTLKITLEKRLKTLLNTAFKLVVIAANFSNKFSNRMLLNYRIVNSLNLRVWILN